MVTKNIENDMIKRIYTDLVQNNIKLSIVIVLFFASTSFIYNYLNVLYIKNSINNPSLTGLKYGYTYQSPDDEYYVDPAKNLVNGKGYTMNPDNLYLNVRRTPGYSIFYAIHYFILGEKYSYFFIRITQCMLFGLSVLLLIKSLILLKFNQQIVITSLFIYGFSPFVPGSLFHTITEGIHPQFVMFFFYFSILAITSKKYFWFLLAGLLGAISFMIRPTNILAPFLMGLIFLYYFFKKFIDYKSILIYLFGIMIIWSPWIIRNYIVKKEFIPFETYYYSPTLYGAMHFPIENLWMCWGNPRHERLLNNISFDIFTDNRAKSIDEFLNEFPSRAYNGISKQELRSALLEVSYCYEQMIRNRGSLKYYAHDEKIFQCDLYLHNKFKKLYENYAKEEPFQVYVYVPLVIRTKEFIFQSFASSYSALNDKTGDNYKWWQFIVKTLFYILNVSYFVSLFYCLIFKIKDFKYFFFLFFPIITIVFYDYAFHIEGRYLISAYPFFAVLLSISLIDFYNFISLKIQPKC